MELTVLLVNLFIYAVMTPDLLPVKSWQLSGTQAQLVTLKRHNKARKNLNRNYSNCYFHYAIAFGQTDSLLVSLRNAKEIQELKYTCSGSYLLSLQKQSKEGNCIAQNSQPKNSELLQTSRATQPHLQPKISSVESCQPLECNGDYAVFPNNLLDNLFQRNPKL